MDENLLTNITRRWRGATATDRNGRLDSLVAPTNGPDSILIVHAGDQTSDLGWQAEKLAETATIRGLTATVLDLGFRGSQDGLLKRVIGLIGQIQTNKLTHLLVNSYGELLRLGLITVVLSLFFGKPIVLELSGSWAFRFKSWQKIALKGWIGRSAALIVPYGSMYRFEFGRGLRVQESLPLINLESRLSAVSSNLQPSILADCRSCATEQVNELIEGFEQTKLKYPRTELTFLAPAGYRAQSDRPGLTVKNRVNSDEIDRLIDHSELFITAHTAPLLDRALLTAAAGGRIILTGKTSSLAKCLRERYRFDPITFSNRSELASQIFRLIESPDLIGAHSRRSVVLAEQFAVDNLAKEILDRYTAYYARA